MWIVQCGAVGGEVGGIGRRRRYVEILVNDLTGDKILYCRNNYVKTYLQNTSGIQDTHEVGMYGSSRPAENFKGRALVLNVGLFVDPMRRLRTR